MLLYVCITKCKMTTSSVLRQRFSCKAILQSAFLEDTFPCGTKDLFMIPQVTPAYSLKTPFSETKQDTQMQEGKRCSHLHLHLAYLEACWVLLVE